MKETRIFIDVIHHDNGDINFYVGGGDINGEFHRTIPSAIRDVFERVTIERNLMLKEENER